MFVPSRKNKSRELTMYGRTASQLTFVQEEEEAILGLTMSRLASEVRPTSRLPACIVKTTMVATTSETSKYM